LSNIFVPIDYTKAREAIPVGEDIIYSTLGKYVKNYGNSTSTYETHLLLTEKGLAYIKIDRPKYKPWYKIIMITTRPPQMFTKKVNPRVFSIVRDKNHESKESYKERKKNFIPILLELYVNALKNRLEEIKANPELGPKKEIKNHLKNLPKRVSKYSKLLEKHKK